MRIARDLALDNPEERNEGGELHHRALHKPAAHKRLENGAAGEQVIKVRTLEWRGPTARGVGWGRVGGGQVGTLTCTYAGSM